MGKSVPKTLAPSEWIDLLIDRAPAMRAAGMTRVSIDGVDVELAPHVPIEEGKRRRNDSDDEAGAIDPLADAATYGRSNGVPGFERPKAHDTGEFE